MKRVESLYIDAYILFSRGSSLFILGRSYLTTQGYQSEINRLRRRLPYMCNALDVYSIVVGKSRDRG